MGASLSYPEVDLSGKVAVVTGGNTGIGYETAKVLAVKGAQTIIACRSEARATAAIQRMKEEVAHEFPDKDIKVEFMLLDLASFHSTKEFVSAFHDRNIPLHLLINNAAIAPLAFDRTEDGNEMSYQVNHLSHFLLTLELLPVILETAASTGDCRIVLVSSRGHRRALWEPESINTDEQHSSIGRTLKYYGKSKLYNVMMAYALQRRLQNVGITVSSLHPGVVNTEAYRYAEESYWYINLLAKVVKPLFRNAKDGAATTINCAVNPELNTQQCFYYNNCRREDPTVTSRNEQYQEHLWEISISAVRDYLSPETLEKYGRTDQSVESGVEEGGTSTQQEGGEEGEAEPKS